MSPARKAAASSRAKATPASKAPAGAPARPPARPPARRTFDDVIAAAPASVQETARALRSIVQRALPDADEGVYGGAKVGIALYSLGGSTRVICGIQPSGARCLFYLHRIAPDDAAGLRLEGKGRHALHVAFATPREVPAKQVAALLALSRARLG